MAKSLSRFSTFSSGLSVAFGVMVLTGWALHIQRLKGIIPGQVPVKANTGLCFVLIGVGLWLAIAGMGKPFVRPAAKGVALLASVIGLLSFLECWRGWDLGIDQLLFIAGPDDLPGSVRLALMSPISAADFFLLGMAIAVLDSQSRWYHLLQNVLSAIAALAAIFGILDFVLDPQKTHTHVAPLTALLLFLFSFAVLCARSDVGFGRLLLSRTAGGVLCRRLLPSAILIPIAIAWLRWNGQQVGLYSEWTGLVLTTVTSAALLAALTVWTAYVVDRSDAERNKAEESARSLAAIVTYSNDAIIGKTLDGIVTSWNPGAEAIYGYSAEEMIGQSVNRIIPADRIDELQRFLQQLRSGKAIRHYETERVRKAGKKIPVSVSISPLKDAKGAIVGASTITRDITERRKAEDDLRRASLYTRSLIEASLDPLVTISKLGKITDVNKATEIATGRPRDLLIGSDFCDYFTEPEKARAGYARVFQQGSVRDYPLAIRNSSGAVMDVLYNAAVFDGANGEVEGVFAAARDITERKRAEEESQAARDRLALAMTAAKAGSFDWNIVSDVDVWSPEKEMLYGLRPGQFSGSHQDWETYVLPEDLPRVKAEVEGALLSGDFASEFRIRRRDNSQIRWMNVRAKVVFDEKRNPMRMVGINLDVTERKQAEEKVQEASRYTRSLIEASLDPLVTISADGKISDVNQATEMATGFSRDQLIGSDFSTYFTEPEKARQGYQQVFTRGMVRDYPLTLRRMSGSAMEVLYNATVFKGADGEVEGVFAAARDITERKQAEEALHRSESRYRSLVTATAQIVWTTNRDGQVVDDMPMWRNYTGMTRQQISGAGWLDSVHPDDRSRTEQVWGKAWRNRERYETEYRIRHKDGEYRTFSVRGVPVLENDGTLREWVGTCTDITDRKLAEEQVRKLNDELEQRVIQRTAELEAANKELEAFTYSVSHDLRAPLRHISGFSKMLSEEYSASLPPAAQHDVQRIQEGTRRMGELVDDLLNLGRVGRKDLARQVSGLRSIVDEVIASLQSEVVGREVEWKIGDLPYVDCDTPLIRQVFQNLLSNALKFTRPRARAVIEIGQEQRDGGSVVYVRDNGVGFSMKYADKLFGIFQRLHRAEDFEGTGVGLATVQRIIQKHGGRIWAEAELDKGATFYFALGASDACRSTSPAAQAAAKS